MKTKTPREIYYPESDGKPMAETDDHRDWMVCLIERLKQRYRGKKVYVSGNLFIYYEEGNPAKAIAPDVFLVFKCNPRRRRIFKTWEEGKGPDFVLETTSKKTRGEDTGKKKLIFAQLGVREYFLYDPLAEWLKPPLQGFRLHDGAYEPIPAEADGSIVSKVLGVRFVLEFGELAMYDLATGQRVLNKAELADEALREKEEAERNAEEAQRHRIEAERKREKAERKREEAERQKSQTDARLAEEVARRRALEDEIAQLRARQGPSKNGGGKNGGGKNGK